MATIPGFWEGGPHDPIDVEATWREFVRSAGGQVVDDLLSGQRDFENADFLFPSEQVVAELKEIQTEFERAPAFRTGYEALLKRLMEENPLWRPVLLGGSGEYPKWFVIEFIRLFRPPISRVLKKANRQIRETKQHFKLNAPKGILIFVNDGFIALEPHYVRELACNLLVDSYSEIHCFLYLTVNRYVEIEGSDVPRLLWMPTYGDRASDELVSFVDDLGRKWFDLLEKKIGTFTIPREERAQSLEGPPLLSRAIRLPDEI